MGDFGKTLKRERIARGWSQEELSKKSGLSREWITKLETQGREPKLTTLCALAQALEIPVQKFLT